jgi:biopolymer transport protein ExbB/TolQ
VETVDFSIVGALTHFTALTWSVFFVLVVMSVASVAVAINRALYFFRARSQSVLFATTVSEGLGKGDVDGVLAQADEEEAVFSYLARIVSTGLKDARDVKDKMGTLDRLETVGSAMERTIVEEGVGLRKWLTILATTASTAPFVGLLGTVFGIINSFKGMATAESAGISAIAGGIAEALYMTGLGLVVAIPAVWLYNWANARVEGFEAEMSNAASEMLDWVKKNKSSI